MSHLLGSVARQGMLTINFNIYSVKIIDIDILLKMETDASLKHL